MDPRERWQALQAQLTTARALYEAGDRAKALEAVEAALAIDPNFLAAHSLHDRIRSAPAPLAAPQTPTAAVPLVSTDGYAKFELRARRRRVDRRLDAARAALERGRFKDAASALDEVIELDPNLPEAKELAARLQELRRTGTERHTGRWLAAAAAFVGIVLGSSYVQEPGSLWSRSMVAMAPLVAPPGPAATTVLAASAATVAEAEYAADEPVATTGANFTRREPEREPDPVPFARIDRLSRVSDVRPAERTIEPAAAAIASPPATARPVQDLATPAVAFNVPPPAPQPLAPPPPVTTAASVAPAPIIPTVDDEGLVKQVLQRYRTAYDGLDARSAHAVWPQVNEPALARAFSGLESQTLTFDACDVRLHGEAALATCHGSARYVPKVGSREPRIEPRVWNFTLKKNGADWEIETARADR